MMKAHVKRITIELRFVFIFEKQSNSHLKYQKTRFDHEPGSSDKFRHIEQRNNHHIHILMSVPLTYVKAI